MKSLRQYHKITIKTHRKEIRSLMDLMTTADMKPAGAESTWTVAKQVMDSTKAE